VIARIVHYPSFNLSSRHPRSHTDWRLLIDRPQGAAGTICIRGNVTGALHQEYLASGLADIISFGPRALIPAD